MAQTGSIATTTNSPTSQELVIAPSQTITSADLNANDQGFWGTFWLRLKSAIGTSSSRKEAERQLLVAQLLDIGKSASTANTTALDKKIDNFQADSDRLKNQIAEDQADPGVEAIGRELEDSMPLQAGLIDQMRVKANVQHQKKLTELRLWAIGEIAGILDNQETDTKKLVRLNQFQAELAGKETKLADQFARKIALTEMLANKEPAKLGDLTETELENETDSMAKSLNDNNLDPTDLSEALTGESRDRLKILNKLTARDLQAEDKIKIEDQAKVEKADLEDEVEASPDRFFSIFTQEKDDSLKTIIEQALSKTKREDIIKKLEVEKESTKKADELKKESAKKAAEVKKEASKKNAENSSSGSGQSGSGDGSSSSGGGGNSSRLEFTVTMQSNTFSGLQTFLTKGRETRIRLHNTDNSNHSFTIAGLGISKKVEAGHDEDLTFTPTTAGTFTVTSSFDAGMTATLTVN